jgi:kumamolisin
MVPKKSIPHFATQSRTVLSGSEKAPLAEAGGEKPAPLAARITVSVIVRRKTPLKAEHITGEQRLTRAQFHDSHAADPAAVKLVQRFAKEFGMTVQPGTPAPGRRTRQAHRYSCQHAASIRSLPRAQDDEGRDLPDS